MSCTQHIHKTTCVKAAYPEDKSFSSLGKMVWEPFQGNWAQENAGISGGRERFLPVAFATQ